MDSDTVLSGTAPLQALEPVPGGYAQIVQSHGCLDLVQLALGDGRNGCPAPAVTRLKELLRCRVFEALDHLESGYNAQRYM
jgi:hypothetical protein